MSTKRNVAGSDDWMELPDRTEARVRRGGTWVSLAGFAAGTVAGMVCAAQLLRFDMKVPLAALASTPRLALLLLKAEAPSVARAEWVPVPPLAGKIELPSPALDPTCEALPPPTPDSEGLMTPNPSLVPQAQVARRVSRGRHGYVWSPDKKALVPATVPAIR